MIVEFNPVVIEARIYDLNGRAVRTVTEGWLSGGEHIRVWDGLDDGGHLVAPGAYVVRMVAGGEVRSRVVVRVP